MEGANNQSTEMQKLIAITQIIFKLNEENLNASVEETMKLIEPDFIYSYNVAISILVYSSFVSTKCVSDIYFKYLESLQSKEEQINKDNDKAKILKIFSNYLIYKSPYTQEQLYLVEKMISKGIIDENKSKSICSSYFIHRNKIKSTVFNRDPTLTKIEKIFDANIEKLKANDWELHKKLIEEGHNPNEITKIIRNDEIEKLQEISSHPNFDFNQTIDPSLYERCSFINQINVSLIDYAAFFGSIKCFKYLLLNGAKTTNVGKYAVASGNIEIIKMCEQNNCSFDGACETAIKFHKNDIFKYIYNNKIEKLDQEEPKQVPTNQFSMFGNKLPVFGLFGNFMNQPMNIQKNMKSPDEIRAEKLKILCETCISSGNYEIFSFFNEEEGIHMDDSIIKNSSKEGNLLLVKYLLRNHQFPKNLLVNFSQSGNIESVQFALEQKGIDINVKDICLFYLIFILII